MKVFGVVVVVINAKRFIEYRAREEHELLEGVSRSPSPRTARPRNRARQTTTSKFKQNIKTEKWWPSRTSPPLYSIAQLYHICSRGALFSATRIPPHADTFPAAWRDGCGCVFPLVRIVRGGVCRPQGDFTSMFLLRVGLSDPCAYALHKCIKYVVTHITYYFATGP